VPVSGICALVRDKYTLPQGVEHIRFGF
jgi:hypothetical protein